MTLDPSYIEYPKRRHGYDHEMYRWSAIHERKPVIWPGGKSVAIWACVSLEWFPIVPNDTPFRAPGHIQTAYPDYRHYTARDYGNRVGVYRLLDGFAKAGMKASFATNSAIAERYPELIADIVAAGHEVIAHSTDMNGTIATGVPVDEERALIARSLESLERATGTRPQGWLSIARSQSWDTPDLLREAGLRYCCDWVNDELPYRFNNGLINLPLNHELSDRQIITVQQQSADSYAQQMRDAFDWLAGEGAARVLPLHLTPYIMALPYRIGALEDLLTDLRSRPQAWFATGAEIVGAWEAQQ
ncbi:MAG: polysaccharide deacetylase family protein [Sphingomonadaceae bacterium]|nr:polysaccharide deacetylase family protein [Sphingomonadaceae bacterium]